MRNLAARSKGKETPVMDFCARGEDGREGEDVGEDGAVMANW